MPSVHISVTHTTHHLTLLLMYADYSHWMDARYRRDALVWATNIA